MSLRDKLVGPTEDEVLDNLKHLTIEQLLMKSCEIGLFKGVEFALEKKVDVHHFNNISLRKASLYGHTDIVKLLLENGADVHSDNDYPLKISKRLDNTETHKLIQNYIIDKKLIL